MKYVTSDIPEKSWRGRVGGLLDPTRRCKTALQAGNSRSHFQAGTFLNLISHLAVQALLWAVMELRFIPKNFDLAWPQLEREKAAALPPELIRDDERWRVFFKADRACGAVASEAASEARSASRRPPASCSAGSPCSQMAPPVPFRRPRAGSWSLGL